MFPELDDTFISQCLRVYNNNYERVVDSILEGSLPYGLANRLATIRNGRNRTSSTAATTISSNNENDDDDGGEGSSGVHNTVNNGNGNRNSNNSLNNGNNRHSINSTDDAAVSRNNSGSNLTVLHHSRNDSANSVDSDTAPEGEGRVEVRIRGHPNDYRSNRISRHPRINGFSTRHSLTTSIKLPGEVNSDNPDALLETHFDNTAWESRISMIIHTLIHILILYKIRRPKNRQVKRNKLSTTYKPTLFLTPLPILHC